MAKTKVQIEDELRQAQQLIEALQTEKHEYRNHVRAVALEAAKEESWCRPGLNAALKELDLPTVSDVIEVTANVDVTFRVQLGDTADPDEFDAEDYLSSYLELSMTTYSDNWDVVEFNVTDVMQEQTDG
jgi:hypothetical protein